MTSTIAFVLSGGGNYGALQAGALRALLERKIIPDLIVGTSAGAINAAYFAARPSLDGVDEIAAIWQRVTKDDVYPGTHLHVLWRVMTRRESLFPNQNFYKFLASHYPQNVRTFGALRGPKLFVTAAHLTTGELRLYGDDHDETVLEAVMASTALPPFSPPWRGADGRLYVDGGTVSDLPLGVALQKGASEIYALHIVENAARAEMLHEQQRSLMEVSHLAVRALLRYQTEAELALARAQRRVTLHYIRLSYAPGISLFDFSHSSKMIESGYQQTRAYFDALPQPAPWSEPLKRWTVRFERAWKLRRYVTLSE
jgi:NTE family protein